MSANEEYTPLEVFKTVLKPIILVYRATSIVVHESLTYRALFTLYI